MIPTIELIQLMLRAEYEAEAQRRPQMFYRDDLADEKPICLPRTTETTGSTASSICLAAGNRVSVHNQNGWVKNILAWLRGWPRLGFLQGAASNWLLVSIILYLAIYPLVIFIFVPRGKAFALALEEALAQGRITAELTASFWDKTVRWAHHAENALVAAIVYLMVMKPF